jgi:arabinogalactan endo-1,4-beta-galactosidase
MRMIAWTLLCCGLLFPPVSEARPRAFMTGVDANYALQQVDRTWTVGRHEVDPIAALARAGADSFRVRLWTGDDGPNGLRYATETALRAQAAGMRPYVVLFLSEGWADFEKQPAPAVWADLPYEDKVATIEAYAARVTQHLVNAGVKVDLFEIGNEIDFGVCGEFEEEWPKRVSIDYMRARVWPRMAPILAAAQRGVRRVKPDARFVLHLTRWDEPAYDLAFWQTMQAQGVTVDLAGLSYFPSSNGGTIPALLANAHTIHEALDRPVLLCETAYPSEPAFPGQFATWNQPVAQYPLDEAGQAAWLRDLLRATRASDDIAGAYYWSPEWLGSGMWDAFALFRADGTAKPALRSLR